MDLSGSIQVWNNTTDPATFSIYQTRGHEDVVVEGYARPNLAVALFEAEVLRIKEAPHGTEAE